MQRIRLIPALGCLFAALLLFAPGPLRGETPRPLVVDMTTLTRTPRASAIAPFIAQKTPLQPGTYPLISGSAPEFLDAFRWVYPAKTEQHCPAPLPTVEAQLEQVRGLIVELELDRALGMLQEAYETIPCHTTVISREALRRLFYFEGIVRNYQGDAAGSERAFLEALGVDPSLVPLAGFPPEIADAYLAAARQVTSINPVRLDVDPGLRQAGLKIDGAALPDAEQVSLAPGRHMAQVTNEAGIARGAVFTLQPGDSRPMQALIEILPPGSGSYLKELLRTSLQSGSLTPAQTTALEAYARLQNHPLLMFVLVSSQEAGGLSLLTFEPGKGLREGASPDLKALPPMGEAGAAGDDRKGEKVKEPRKGRKGRKEPGPREQEPQEKEPRKEPEERPEEPGDGAELPDSLISVDAGVLSYDGALFTGVHPAYARRLVAGLYLRAGLYAVNDLGLNGDAPVSMYGARLGGEYAFPLGPATGRAGLGYSLTAARIEVLDGQRTLVLEGTPELWLRAGYPLGERLLLGLEAGGGYSPGLVNAEGGRGLWRAGMFVGVAIP